MSPTFKKLLIVFLIWIVCFVFASFTGLVALDLPRPDNALTRFLEGRVNRVILFWTFLGAAIFSYIVGPIMFAVIFVKFLIAKFGLAKKSL